MENFDFNIDNYSVKNMEDFLNLPYGNYTEIEINEKVQTMKDTLLKSKESYQVSSKINAFLNEVQEALLLNIRTTNHYSNKTRNVDINNVYNYKYVTGTVNPIERQTQKKSVCINSLFRTNYFKSDSYAFDYIFPTPIENIISMKLAFVEIPFFWYGISAKKKNNTFTINLFNVMTNNNTVSVPDSTHTITIEDGNYTTSLLTTYLNNYFNYNGTSNGLNYLIFSISEIDSKITFRAKTSLDDDTINPFVTTNFYYSPNFTYEIIFSDTPFFDPENNYSSTITDQYSKYLKSAASILGFKLNTYTVTPTNTYYDYSTATVYNAYLQSEYSYGKYVYQYLFLEVNDYHNNFTTDMVISLVCNNKYISNNILSVLPVIGNQNTIMFDKTSGENISREYFGPVKLTKLTIRILNQYGEVLDLNGYDYFIILELQQIYSNYNII